MHAQPTPTMAYDVPFGYFSKFTWEDFLFLPLHLLKIFRKQYTTFCRILSVEELIPEVVTCNAITFNEEEILCLLAYQSAAMVVLIVSLWGWHELRGWISRTNSVRYQVATPPRGDQGWWHSPPNSSLRAQRWYLCKAFTSMHIAERRQLQQQFIVPDTTFTASPHLDKVMAAECTKSTKSADQQLSRIQAPFMNP